jgi:hypothetical protein
MQPQHNPQYKQYNNKSRTTQQSKRVRTGIKNSRTEKSAYDMRASEMGILIPSPTEREREREPHTMDE